MRYSARPAAVLSCLVFVFSLAPTAPAAPVIKLQVTAEQANIREKPDIMSAVLDQAPMGAILEAEKKEGEWFAVRVEQEGGGTVTGYVHESLVKVVEGAPTPVVKPEEPQPPPKQPEQQKPPRPAKPVKEARPAEAGTPPREVKEQPKPAPRPPGVPPEPARGRETGRASISLWYGGRYAVGGDLNDGAKGQAAFYCAAFGVKDPNAVGSVHVGRVLGIEYRRPLVRGLDAAIGLEYFSAQRSSIVNLLGGTEPVNFRTTPRVSVFPVSLSLVFYPVSNIYIKTGLDLSIARCRYLYRLEQGELFKEWDGKADSVGLGYLLGGGLEWGLGGPVSVLAEATYRNARIANLDGEETYRESGMPDVVTKGTLYFYRAVESGSLTVPQVFVRAAIPTGADIVEARKAELSLSGLNLRVGLKIAF
jgi:hypothetical protein